MDKSYYSGKVEEISKIVDQLEQQLNKLGTLRILSFIAGVVLVVLGFEMKMYTLYAVSIVCFVYFTILVKKYGKLSKKKNYEQAKKQVYVDNLSRLNKEWREFSITGEEFDEDKLVRTKDLDLLGKGSIFQYLCVANTPYGKKSLAKALTTGTSSSQIVRRQEAIKELIDNKSLSIHLKTLSKMVGEDTESVDAETIESFIQSAEEKLPTRNSLMGILSFLLPIIGIVGIVLMFTPLSSTVIISVTSLVLLAQYGLGIWFGGIHAKFFDPAVKFCKNIEAYEEFLYAIEKENFKSDYLKELKESLLYKGGPEKAIKGLNGMSELIKVRYNGAAHFILSSILMWDFHCMDSYRKWHKQYGSTVRRWMAVMGEVEALLSLAVIGDIKEVYSFPEIKESDNPYIQFSELKHPLIQEDIAISNSLNIGTSTSIITGSNMSGKTTFLRTIGANLALAYAGAPVLANNLKAGYMEVLTSMRIADDVNEGISTFYAELLRVKEMIEYSKKKKPMLVLIDEIFRGTNSADRILGAKETIHSLEKEWITVMVSTHDFELCELGENKDRESYNYHFSEYYENDEIKFSYKMQDGRSKTTNARFLLKMVGIIN